MKESDALAAPAGPARDVRLRAFRTLVGAAPAGLRPGELAEALDVPGSTLSVHLNEPTRAGLVMRRHEGRTLVYRPAPARTRELVAYLTAHCRRGAGCDAARGRSRCRLHASPRSPDGPADGRPR